MKRMLVVSLLILNAVGCTSLQEASDSTTESDYLNQELENRAIIRSVENQVFNTGPGIPF